MLSEDVTCATGTAQRIGHVAGDRETALLQAWIKYFGFDRGKFAEFLCAQCDFASVGFPEAATQGAQHACPAVVGCAAPDAYDKVAAPLIQRVQDQFSHTVCGGVHGITLLRGHERKSGGFCHFDDGCVIRQDAVGCFYGFAQRSSDGYCDTFTGKSGY